MSGTLVVRVERGAGARYGGTADSSLQRPPASATTRSRRSSAWTCGAVVRSCCAHRTDCLASYLDPRPLDGASAPGQWAHAGAEGNRRRCLIATVKAGSNLDFIAFSKCNGRERHSSEAELTLATLPVRPAPPCFPSEAVCSPPRTSKATLVRHRARARAGLLMSAPSILQVIALAGALVAQKAFNHGPDRIVGSAGRWKCVRRGDVSEQMLRERRLAES
eukprot:s1179_g21.t1